MANLSLPKSIGLPDVSGLSIWLCLPLSIAFGVLAVLALAPLYLWPLMVVGVGGLFWLLAAHLGWRRGFVLGWGFGLGYFLVGLHWVGHAFLVDAARFGWMMPIALFVLAGGMALYSGLAAALAVRFSPPGWRRLVALALFWGLSEWLRGTLLTGFPWLLIGHVWAAGDGSLQAAAYFGASGLGLLTVFAAATPALVLTAWPGQRRRALLLCGLALGLVGLIVLAGALRLPDGPVAMNDVVRLRLVQGGIPQADKWRPELRDRHLARYMRLSLGRDVAGRRPQFTHLIWPETATPFFLTNDPVRRDIIAQALPPHTTLISGTPRAGVRRNNQRELYNSIATLSNSGETSVVYDKSHLVPFGEYLPFRDLLSRFGIDKLAHGAVDFSTGSAADAVSLPKLPPFRPLICYEIIFPREIMPSTNGPAPQWLLNLTNDAWFGEGFGPRQHIDIARIRAAEFGLPVVRAANTGISAVIDPYGRITKSLPLKASGVIDNGLPLPLPNTPYRLLGDGIFAVMCAVLAVLLFLPMNFAARKATRGS